MINIEKIEKKPRENKNKIIVILKSFLILLFIFVEIISTYYLYVKDAKIFRIVVSFSYVLKIITAIKILNLDCDITYKFTWIFAISFSGILGIILYFSFGDIKLKDVKVEEDLRKYFKGSVTYIETGEKFFSMLKKDLIKAKESIFLQFYIIKKGKLLDDITSVLKEKAKSGVQVNIIVDSLGSLCTFPKKIVKDMEVNGINVYKYNKFQFNLSKFINFRNHQKMVIIDSKVCYIGGVNIADEYVNLYEKYGRWKDAGVKLKGNVTKEFEKMFFKNLEEITGKVKDYEKNIKSESGNGGYMIALEDGANIKNNPIENTVIDILENAQKYFYLATPYLAFGPRLSSSIIKAKLSGIDIKLVVPHIPDKKIVNIITKSSYEKFLEAGIKIYEYTPGFIHSKILVCDDEKSIAGTSNFDFRSFNLNKECAIYFSQTKEEKNVRKDFDRIIKDSVEIKLDDWKNRSKIKKMSEKFFNIFSPLI